MPSGFVNYFFGPGPGTKKTARFETDESIRRANEIEKARLAAIYADQQARERELSKYMYVNSPDAKTAEQRFLDYKTSPAFAGTALNQAKIAEADSMRTNAPILGEAEAAQARDNTSLSNFNIAERRGRVPSLSSNAFNAEQSSREAVANRNTALNNTLTNVEPGRIIAENQAGIDQAINMSRTAREERPTIPARISAQASSYPVQEVQNTTALQNENLAQQRNALITPENLLTEHKAATSAAEAKIFIQQLIRDYPELFQHMNRGDYGETPKPIPGLGIRGQTNSTALGIPTNSPNPNALPTKPLRRLGQPIQ